MANAEEPANVIYIFGMDYCGNRNFLNKYIRVNTYVYMYIYHWIRFYNSRDELNSDAMKIGEIYTLRSLYIYVHMYV